MSDISKARLKRSWAAPAYAFFDPEVQILHVNGRRVHEFRCSACKHKVLRYLDNADKTSTANLRYHVKRCKNWGPDVLTLAEGLTASETRERLKSIPRMGSLQAAFERKGKGKVTFSTVQHTKEQTR